MPTITVRQLSKAAHRALALRAAQHHRSLEAEVCDILEKAVKPSQGFGSVLAAIGQRLGGADLDTTRDPAPVRPKLLG